MNITLLKMITLSIIKLHVNELYLNEKNDVENMRFGQIRLVVMFVALMVKAVGH